MKKIKFGTDGWRAIIAEDFTMDNVRLVSQAIADVLKRERGENLKMIIGYDTRFMSLEFSKAIATVFAANNIKVLLADKVAPTPIVSFMVKHTESNGGIVVTASHNPSNFNGIKFKDYYGGPGHPEMTQKFEQEIGKTPVKDIDYNDALAAGTIEVISFDEPYVLFLKTFLNLELLNSGKWKVAVDSMYGAGGDYFERLLGTEYAGSVTTIGKDINPGFGGVSPEPIPKNLKQLIEMCKLDFDIGLATDGDGDRIGVIDDNGTFVYSHQLIALFVLYLQESRGWAGDVAKSISTTALINKIAKDKNFHVYETPIGFKHICTLMCEKDILIGGEESGGIGFKNHVPERDGILAGLLVLEMMTYYKLPLSQIIQKMNDTYGQFYYERNDVHYDIRDMDKILGRLSSLNQTEIEGLKVAEINTEDGIKHIFEDGSWMLIRGSGTEPVLRIYAESQDVNMISPLLAAGEKIALGTEFTKI